MYDDVELSEERSARGGRTLDDIQIRDPFLLDDGSSSWLHGSTDENIWSGPGVGSDAYRSSDLRKCSASTAPSSSTTPAPLARPARDHRHPCPARSVRGPRAGERGRGRAR